MVNRFGDGKIEIHSGSRKWRAQEQAGSEEDERNVTAAELEEL